MRVIAGTKRGRSLRAPKGLATRPVLARVREALFSMLGDLDGARVLDLYAGTGAIGIEALSRGAETAVFVDSGVPPCRAIRENLDTLGLEGEIMKMDAARAVDLLARGGRMFDFVFADPPYDLGLAADAVVRVCGSGILAPRGIVAVTARKTETLPKDAGDDRTILVDRRYGDTRLAVYGAAEQRNEPHLPDDLR